MAAEPNKTNPWVRANLHQYDPYTESLLPAEAQPAYVEIITEVGAAAMALSEACERNRLALLARAEFFNSHIYTQPPTA